MGFLVDEPDNFLGAGVCAYGAQRTCDHCAKSYPAPDVRKATIDHEGNTQFLCPKCFAERGIEAVGKSLLELMNPWGNHGGTGGG